MDRDLARSPAPAALVLVIDDDLDNRDIYSEYLRFAGFRVVTAPTAEEGLVLAVAEAPAVVIMDVGLPHVDGWEATRRLKADPRTAKTRVLIVTGLEHDDAYRSALEAGADDFCMKPCLPADLLRRIRALLGMEPRDDGTRSGSGARRKRSR
jgi:DNA-binding response OmpR family regulator